MKKPLQLAAAFVLAAAASLPLAAQQGTSSFAARPVVKVGSQGLAHAPTPAPKAPVGGLPPKPAARIQASPGPGLKGPADLLKGPAPAPLLKESQARPVGAALDMKAPAALPVASRPHPQQRPQPVYPIREDASEIFVTTADRPTQEQAERLAALCLGRPARPGEMTLCAPSEGFALRLPKAIHLNAAARDKARHRLLSEPDVVTVTPSVTEGPDRYYVAGQVLANCRPDMSLEAVEKTVAPLGARVLEEHDHGRMMRVFVVQVPKGADPRVFANTLEKLGLADEVVPNVQAWVQHTAVIPTDPLYPNQWYMDQASDQDIDAETAWEYYDASDFSTWTSIAVVDGEGFDLNHPDIAGMLYNSYDATNNDNSPMVESTLEIRGTPTLGVAAARNNNGAGLASVGNTNQYVIPIKIGFNWDGLGGFATNTTIISRAATRVIVSQRVTATSHSYAMTGAFWTSDAFNYYFNMYAGPRENWGAAFCAAAGNDGQANQVVYPAAYSFAISVGASNQTDQRAVFSNYGTTVHMAAPGQAIQTIDRLGAAGWNGTDYAVLNGTSFATPMAASVCGALGRIRMMMADSIRHYLLTTCEKVGGYSYTTSGPYGMRSNELGYGRLNFLNAISRVRYHGWTFDLKQFPNRFVGNLYCGGTYTRPYGQITEKENYLTVTVPQRTLLRIKINASSQFNVWLSESSWTPSSYFSASTGSEMETTILVEPGTRYLRIMNTAAFSSSWGYSINLTCLCLPTYANKACSSGDYINSVRFGAAPNSFDSTGCPKERWENYTGGFQPGPAYITNNSQNWVEIHSGPKPQAYTGFIDYNADGIYTANENVFVSNTLQTKAVIPFNPSRPELSTVVFYRTMRIISSGSPFADPTNACASLATGEVEDRYLTVVDSDLKVFGSTSDEYVRGLVRDGAGNTYMSLSFQGTISFYNTQLSSSSPDRRDMALAKISPSNQLLWVHQVGNGQFNMEPRGVNIDGQGNPYWAGSFVGTVYFQGGFNGLIELKASGSYDAFVARLNPANGLTKWAKKVGSTGSDYLYGCFVSNSGNVYAGGSYGAAFSFPTLTGTIDMPNAGQLDAYIVKFDSSGNGIWANRASSAGNDEVKSIEYMGGDLVACGYMGNNCTFGQTTLASLGASQDAWAARINSNGGYVWVKNFGSTNGDEAHSICIDPTTSNVFVAARVGGSLIFNGTTYPHQGHNDIAVVGYNFYTQAPVWASQKGSGAGDVPHVIRWDGAQLVVAGFASGSFNPGSGTLSNAGLQDGVCMRYNKATGAVTSALMFGGAGNDFVEAMWVNTATREAWLGGSFSGTATFPQGAIRLSSGGYDGFLMRLSAPANARLGAEEDAPLAQAGQNALHLYPVPAGKSLYLDGEGLEPEEIQVLDAKGTRLPVPVQPEGSRARLDIKALPAGIYLVRAGGKTGRFVKE